LHLKQHTDVAVSLGVTASRPSGGPIGLHCFVEVALLLEGVAESETGFGIIRIEPYGMPVSGDGFRRPPLLLQQQPEIVITRRIIRPQLNLSTNEPFGTGEIALLRR